MANSINLEELRAQRAGRSAKTTEEAVEKFIETGEVAPEPVEIDPRQQSFFKEEPVVEEASVVETVAQEKVTEEVTAKQSPAQPFIQVEAEKDNMTEKELYDLLKQKNFDLRRRDGKKSTRAYSICLPNLVADLVDKMSENRYMTRSSLLNFLIMKGISVEMDGDVRKTLPRPVEA